MAKKPTGAVSSIPGVLPGMDSSYYQQVAHLVSQSFAQTSARQNAHYGALISIVGQTGNTLMAGMQNYMAYSLEKQKMLFERDLASRQLDLAVQDMDIKRLQADRAYELQNIEKQRAIQQLTSAKLEGDRTNERWKAQAALGEAQGKLHDLLGEIGDLAPTQDQERQLSELAARMNMAYTAASSVGGVDEVAMKNRSEVLEAVRGKTHVEINGAPVPLAQLREQVTWSGSIGNQATLVADLRKDMTKYGKLDSGARKTVDAWANTFTTGAISPDLDSDAAYLIRTRGWADPELMTARAEYLAQTNDLFAQGWKDANDKNLRGPEQMAHALSYAHIVDHPAEAPAPAVSWTSAPVQQADGQWVGVMSDGTQVTAESPEAAEVALKSRRLLASRTRVFPSPDEARRAIASSLPDPSSRAYPVGDNGTIYARAIENGISVQRFFSDKAARYYVNGLGADELGRDFASVGKVLTFAGTGGASAALTPLVLAGARALDRQFRVTNFEQRAMARDWAENFVIKAEEAYSRGKPEEFTYFMAEMRKTYDQTPSDLKPAFRVGPDVERVLRSLKVHLGEAAAEGGEFAQVMNALKPVVRAAPAYRIRLSGEREAATPGAQPAATDGLPGTRPPAP